MSSVLQFPFVRLQYPAIDNPMYVTDVVCADQQTLDAITAVCGLGPTDFAILSGLEYTVAISGPNYYTPGVFYFNGVWYYQPFEVNENDYLKANITPIMPYTFSDSVIRNTYQLNFAQSTTSPTGATPQFTGDMNAYRISNQYLADQIKILQLTVIEEASLPASYVVTFEKDKSIFFASATFDTNFSFDFTGAVPGTVVRIKFTMGAGINATASSSAGQTILLESGDFGLTTSNINLLTILYAGVNESGNHEASLVLTQPTAI